jgi:hypothetical protein
MGTRGFITFVVSGEEKTSYNHFDSYPDGLGLTMLEWAQGVTDWSAVRTQAEQLRLVTDKSEPPTPEDIERFRQYSWNREQHGGPGDLRPGQQWYDLLHETQGDPAKILEAGVTEDHRDFPMDSLFAEWGYVIDLDASMFEVYRGFQREAHAEGRFAARAARTYGEGVGPYYPVALVASWKLPDYAKAATLDEVPELPTKEQFLIATTDPEEDE